MTPETWLVFSILLITMILFMSDVIRLDVVALSMLLSLLLTQLVTPAEALAGFSQPVVAMIAGLFVIGGGLLQTGNARLAGYWIIRLAGNEEISLITTLMVTVALLSAFMSSTGTVAVFLPIAVSLASQTGIHPARLLMPISFAALLGGMLTLIGTPPNMIVSGALQEAGFKGLGFFSLTPIGLIILVLVIAFMVSLGRYLLPKQELQGQTPLESKHSLSDLAQFYNLSEELFQLKVGRDSPLIGATLRELRLPEKYSIAILSVQHDLPNQFGRKDSPSLALPTTDLQAEDIVVVKGTLSQVKAMAQHNGLIFIADQQQSGLLSFQDIGLAEVIVSPRSRIIGQTIQESRFRERYHLNILSVRRFGQKLEAPFAQIPLRFADMLLIHGEWPKIQLLDKDKRDFVVVNMPSPGPEKPSPKTYLSLGIVLLVLMLMTLEFLAPVTAILLGAVMMLLSSTLR